MAEHGIPFHHGRFALLLRTPAFALPISTLNNRQYIILHQPKRAFKIEHLQPFRRTMKYLSVTVIDFVTLILAAVGVAEIICRSSVDGGTAAIKEEEAVVLPLTRAFTVVASVFCFTNLFGVHKIVKDNWEGGFGDTFFPFEKLNNTEKRVLAGFLELIALFLTVLHTPVAKGTGFAMFMVLYGRGALTHAQVGSFGKSVFVGIWSAVAAWLAFQQHPGFYCIVEVVLSSVVSEYLS